MAALHNLYDFLDEFNEIFGEKAEYEIKSMLDNTITVKMIYKRALPPAQFQPDISNPFDNIAMEGIDSPDVYDRYATAEVKVEKISRRILVTSVVMQRAYARLHQDRKG